MASRSRPLICDTRIFISRTSLAYIPMAGAVPCRAGPAKVTPSRCPPHWPVGPCRPTVTTGHHRGRSLVRMAASTLLRAGGYALGVWAALTAWAALAQYVLPGRGDALGKLGSFHWVLVINLVPALLCALGFAAGHLAMRPRAPADSTPGRAALLLGLLFPLTLPLLSPVLARFGPGLGPALAWCVIGSAGAGGLLQRWVVRKTTSR